MHGDICMLILMYFFILFEWRTNIKDFERKGVTSAENRYIIFVIVHI